MLCAAPLVCPLSVVNRKEDSHVARRSRFWTPDYRLRPDLPQIRECRPRERRLQILRARGSAGARLSADRALDHLDVPISPLLHAFIEIHEPLAELAVLRIGAVDLDQDCWISGDGSIGA